jgi:hypothetical protein
MKMKWSTRSLPLLAFLASPAFPADLSGTVAAALDLSPLPGARVVLYGPGGSEQEAFTDADGTYRFTGLDAGDRYSLDVAMDGFKPFARDGIRISSDAERLDVRLELAAVLESVVVKGTGQVLSVLSNAPDVSQIVTAHELAELPSARRSVVKYSLLNPQVRQTEGVNSDGNQSNRLSIKGQSYRHTGFVLDGIINTDWVYANGPYQLVAASAVEDVRVVLNHYAAEYGPSSSGVVKVNTRSGTRELGGEVFGFLTPSGIQARPPLSPFDVPNRRGQWGALLFGPLVQDKTYYFVSYEGVDQERGAFIQSPEERFFTGQLNETYALGRIDHHLSDAHTLTLRLNFYHYRNTNPNDRVGGFTQPSGGRLERSQSWGGQFTDRVLIGNNAVNYFRFNYSNYQPDNNGPVSPFTPDVRVVRPSYSTEGFSQFNWNKVQLLDFSDTLALNHGRHKLKFGVEVVRLTVRDFLEQQFGEYRFNSGPPTPDENPRDYRHTFGQAILDFDDTTIQVFAQDDFDISPRLSAHVGLRYEYQAKTGDTSRFAPRLGLAWDATEDGRTRITAGAGVFSDHFPLIIYRRILRGGPDGAQESYTIPFGVEGFPTFPESLTEPPTGAEANRRDLQLLADDLRNPYSIGTSLGIERDLGNRFAVAVYGTYQLWEDQWRNNDINRPEPIPRTEPGQIRNAAEADASRPFAEYEGLPVRRINMTENSGSSRYYDLSVSVRRKYSGGLRMEGRYTLSTCNTDSDINAGQPNEWNDRDDAEWGPCDNHQRHRFVGSASVDLPWEMRFAGIAMINSGLPVNPRTGNDNNRDSYGTDRPVDGRGGFLGRNSFRGPGQVHVDVSLAKQFGLGGGRRLEARLDVFNVFNKNNFIHVDNTYGEGPEPGPRFMQPIAGIQDTEPSRRIQLGLRILFGQR